MRLPRFPSLPLLSRLVLTLAAVALLPFAISFYQLRSNRVHLLDQVLRTHIVAASSSASRVASHVGALDSLASSLASNPFVASEPHSVSSQELLAATLQAEPGIAALGLYDPAGEQVVLAQRREMKEEIAPVLAQGDVRELAIVEGLAQRWLRFRRELDDARGYLVLLAEAGPLETMVRPDELGDEAEMALVEPGTGALYGSSGGLEGFPAEVVALASTGKLGSGASKYGRPGQEEQIVAHYQVEGTPWFVLSRQSGRVAEVAQSGIRRATGLAVGATFALAALLTFAADFSVIRPLRRLVRAQQALAGIEPEPAGGGSEIDQLEVAFASLAQRLDDSEELGRVFLGRYQVVELAGAGSMGTVFRGWDPRLQRPVALKTVRLNAEEFDREKLSKRLHGEAVTSARFNHPNIVTVYDMLQGGSSACIAMEFVEGITLEQYLEQRSRLPVEQLVPLGAAIARALESAHEHDLVHHDIKPANILLGHDGSIKVTDFGISQLVSSAAIAQDVVCGTPGYLPPESLKGHGYSPQSDLFSLGVMLYECLDGRHPFAGTNVRDLMLNTLSLDPEAIGLRRPGLPPELAELVMRLIDKDPQQRPAGAGEVADVLEALMAGKSLSWVFDPAAAVGRVTQSLTAMPTILVRPDSASPDPAS